MESNIRTIDKIAGKLHKLIYNRDNILMLCTTLALPALFIIKTYQASYSSNIHINTTADIASNILASLIAAYVFYVIIELYPRKKRNQQAIETLDSILATSVKSYELDIHCHIKPTICSPDMSVLEETNLDNLISSLQKDCDIRRMQNIVKYTAELIPTFAHAHTIAATLSKHHIIAWLKIANCANALINTADALPLSWKNLTPPADIDMNQTRTALWLLIFEIKLWRRLCNS